MTLGEKIKFVRQNRKMSQGDLSKAADIYQKNISRYEQDTSVPSALALKKIADALKVTTDYLLSEGEEVKIKDRDLLGKFEIIQELNGDTKQVVNTFLDLVIRDFKTSQAYTQK